MLEPKLKTSARYHAGPASWHDVSGLTDSPFRCPQCALFLRTRPGRQRSAQAEQGARHIVSFLPHDGNLERRWRQISVSVW
jgi:hypothetical protein